jgi:hypothetical protein
MLTRRRFLGYSALAPAAYRPLLRGAQGPAGSAQAPLRLAIIGSTYHYGSDLQTIADRFLVGYPHDGDWHMPNVQVVSMYVEPKPRPAQPRPPAPRAQAAAGAAENRRPPVAQSAAQATPLGPAGGRIEPPSPPPETSGPLADLSVGRSREFGFRLCANIPEALRCGGDRVAVDAVLAVVEGDYPRNHKNQVLYPRYDFFQQGAQVFEEEGRSVPYFNHGSLSYSFRQAQSMLATAERLKFPLMAGSSLPVTWRLPDTDIPLGAQVQEAVMVGELAMGSTDFDALEAMQAMLERRKGSETGVKAVQLLEGDDVWAAGDSGRWSKELLSSALSRSDAPLGLTVLDGRPQDLVAAGVLPQLAKDPAAYCIEYNDGTRATLLMLTGADQDFTFSARVAGQGLIATQFFRAPLPNVTYSACLTAKIEQMFMTRSAPYPVRRTLLTSGILEAAMTSRSRLNQRLETPQLAVKYDPPAESQYART